MHVMSLTWVGGGNNSAANPFDWSPHGTPKFGETLTMTHGTMHVSGMQLAGDPLHVPSGSVVTVDVSGVTNLTLDTNIGSVATVNLAAHSEWVGGFTDYGMSDVIVKGPGVFANKMSFVNGSALIQSDVVGTGTFQTTHGHGNEVIEFAGAVSRGQTVDIFGRLGDIRGATVQVDHPGTYHAMTDISLGNLLLEGLRASSYTYHNDMLTLFEGNKIVGKFGIESSPEYAPKDNIVVFQCGSAIDVFKGLPNAHGVTLPVHW